GGVIAVNGLADAPGESAAAEGGSFGFARATASAAMTGDNASLSGALGWQRATGIDSFTGHGDKDGYRNLSGRFRGSVTVTPGVELGASALLLTERSEFDGFDPVSFAHTDTLDSSRNRLAAGRAWLKLGNETASWSGQVSASLLGSSNRNDLAGLQQNRTAGSRRNIDAQLEHRFSTGLVAHTVIAAADLEREAFHAHDTIYGGLSDQDRTRDHRALTLEWRGETKALVGDVAVRRDLFNRFKDATSLRASVLASLGGGFAVTGAYAEGIAQPTFFDLYGFFPNNFLGNPSLKPESSRGFEASLRYRRGVIDASLTAYRQRLFDEIVNDATFTSVLNAPGNSRRSGIEATIDWRLGDKLRVSANYAYLQATRPDSVSGRRLTETRRPKHSGSIMLDGASGRFTYGASLAFVGTHLDNRDTYPFARVALGSYWLADARVAYALRPGVEVFVRGANLLNQRYEDVFGYRTEPRAAYVGIRLADRRSSP
ncbi:MAG TPA: TonB-dependent receptor, partial [Sphingomicrobium sp.]